MNNRHIIISGPSASGKSTLIKKMLQFYPDLSLSISHTTRPMRKGEENGREYYFVSDEEFEHLINKKRMVEYVKFNNYYYGTSFSELEGDKKIFDVEYRGVAFFKNAFPDFIYIFVDCDRENVEKRLLARGDSKSDIEGRLRLYDNFLEIKDTGIFQKIINNNKAIEESFQEIVEFLTSLTH